METKTVKIASLLADPANARKHDKKNIDAIKASLKQFGQRKNIVVRDGIIIAGNGTVEAAKELGWEDITIAVADDMSATEAKAFALADNRTAELAVWDDDVLGEQLQALYEDGYAIADIGFELDDYGGDKETSQGLTDDDEVPEVEENVFGVKRGDIWQLGEHRLMCGDSTVKDDVDRLMNGEKADMVFTDPPYLGNMGRGGFKNDPKMRKNKDKLMDSIEHIYDFDPTNTFPIIEQFKAKKISIFLFCNKNLIPHYLNYALEKSRLFDVLTWHKPSCMPLNQNTYYPDTEYLIKIKDNGAVFNTGLGDKASYNKYWVLDGKSEGKDLDHPTVKPAKIITDCLLVCSNEKQNVLDLFLGSGSTLIACEKTGRKCYGSEIDPHYCSVIIKRWQDYTGKEAKLLTA